MFLGGRGVGNGESLVLGGSVVDYWVCLWLGCLRESRFCVNF